MLCGMRGARIGSEGDADSDGREKRAANEDRQIDHRAFRCRRMTSARLAFAQPRRKTFMKCKASNAAMSAKMGDL
jgi:hypothetical protein